MRRFACAWFLCLWPGLAAAQAPPAPPPLREGTVDFSFVSTTGNSSTQSVGLSADVIFRPDSWEIRNRAAFVRAESDDTVSAQAFAYQFKAARKVTSRLSAYGQYDYLRDTFAGVDHRNGVLGGADYLLLGRERQSLKVFGGLGYANERRITGDDVSTGVLDTGWAYKLKFSATAEFTDDLRYGASFYASKDWRLGHVAAVTARLTQLLSLKVSHTTRYSNFPPPGFEKTDTITAVALVAKF